MRCELVTVVQTCALPIIRLEPLRARLQLLFCRPLLSRRALLSAAPADARRPRLSRRQRALLLPPVGWDDRADHRRARRWGDRQSRHRWRVAVARHADRRGDRKSVVEGKRVSVRLDLGGRRILKKKQTKINEVRQEE